MIILSEKGLKSLERLEARLLDTPAKRYVIIERERGIHCIGIKFDMKTPLYLIKEIKNDINAGAYPGIKLITIYSRDNLHDCRVCIDNCNDNDSHCYLDECTPREY